MIIKSELFNRLDNCSTQQKWETIYAAASVKLTQGDVYQITTSDKPYAQWFGFRFDAGPPGTQLPTFDEAIERMSKGVSSGGSALDAFQVIFNGRQLPNNTPPEVVLKIMTSCAFFALTKGPTNFATWLAARAGLASIALGSPKLAWRLLNIPSADGQPHPNLQPLEFFKALQGHPHLENNHLIQTTILLQWPSLKVPLFPQLPEPLQNPASNLDNFYIHDTLEQLIKVDAHHIAKLAVEVLSFCNDCQQN